MNLKTRIKQRLEYLRGELKDGNLSYGELAELQCLTPHIEQGDVELLEAAGVPESNELPINDPDLMNTVVVFRMWKSKGGTAIALFPTIGTVPDGHCQSYEHVGQHGAADYELVMSKTRPAKPSEYKNLLCELQRIGYKVIPRSRRPR